jgi:hypothetical protein
MTQKIYQTALGKSVDIGSLRLQNENVRAVGNMGVNARGDRIDSNGKVIDSVNDQLQRRMQRQSNSNVVDGEVHASSRAQKASENAAADIAARPVTIAPASAVSEIDDAIFAEFNASMPKVTTEETDNGLAAAIARSKTVKQELEKTSREKQQSQSVRKI